MYCKNCGKQIDDDSKFCNFCGTQQSISYIGRTSIDSKKIDDNLKIDSNNTGFQKPQIKPKEQHFEKSNETYKNESGALIAGIILMIIEFVIIFTRRGVEVDIQTNVIFIIISFIIRITITVWIVNIAKRRNRTAITWGVLGFIFPAVTLIVIAIVLQKQNRLLENKNYDAVLEKLRYDDSFENNLELLRLLINKENKKTFEQNYKNEILDLLAKLATSRQLATNLIETYRSYQNKDLINDLKGLSTSYSTIKEYLKIFIDYNIVNGEYPHEHILTK